MTLNFEGHWSGSSNVTAQSQNLLFSSAFTSKFWNRSKARWCSLAGLGKLSTGRASLKIITTGGGDVAVVRLSDDLFC